MPRAWKSSGCHGSARGHDRHDKEPDGISARKTANGRKMRRKTIAKRILYNGYEGYEETPEDTGAKANHVFSVCKHQPFVAYSVIVLRTLDVIMWLSFSKNRRRGENGEDWMERTSHLVMLTILSSKQRSVPFYYWLNMMSFVIFCR